VTLPLDDIVAGLNRVQPEIIVAYPSLLHQLAFAAQQGNLEIAPKLFVSSSEPLLPEIRKAVSAVWSAPILNNWASTEAGAMASSCGEGPGLHLSDDMLIVEGVDEQYQPVTPGVRSAKVLATPLFNATPLPPIRYELTDEVTVLEEPCPCGSAHRRVGDIEGRLDDIFKYGARTSVHPHIFRSHLGKERYIVEYQVRQTVNGAQIDIHCNGQVDLAGLRRGLVIDLQRAGLPAAQITIVPVERIERPVSGKLKRFVPLRRREVGPLRGRARERTCAGRRADFGPLAQALARLDSARGSAVAAVLRRAVNAAGPVASPAAAWLSPG
jgi:phenylacetate-CoA ligase